MEQSAPIAIGNMVRFDGYRRSLPLPSPGEQWRLLLWVLLVGLLIIAPRWWLAVRERPKAGHPTIAAHPHSVANRGERETPWVAGRVVGPEKAGFFKTPSIVEELSQIDFTSVRDDVPFRNAEREPWFRIWKLLMSCSPEELWRVPAISATFSQLYRRPRDYRGKLVEIRGYVAGVFPVKAPPNDLEITNYFRIWLCPDGEADPIVIYALTLPPGFPQGQRMAEPAVIRGVFFKRWPYQAQDGLRFAPVVLAPWIRWERPETSATVSYESGPNLLWAVFVACLLTALFLWYVLKVRQKPVPRRSVDGLSTPFDEHSSLST